MFESYEKTNMVGEGQEDGSGRSGRSEVMKCNPNTSHEILQELIQSEKNLNTLV